MKPLTLMEGHKVSVFEKGDEENIWSYGEEVTHEW